MKKLIASTALACVIALSGCEPTNESDTVQPLTLSQSTDAKVKLSEVTQQDIDQIAEQLQVNYRLLTNIPTDKCDPTKADGACFEVLLAFTAPKAINSTGWSIYFSQISPIQSYESDAFDVVHINGDIHRITLKNSFKGFAAGETKSLMFRANFWSLSETDALPNYIVTGDDLQAKVIQSTKTKIDKETGLEILPYVSAYKDKDKHFKRSANDKSQWVTAQHLYLRNKMVEGSYDINSTIIPTPNKINVTSGQSLNIADGLAINLNNIEQEHVETAIQRLTLLGVTFSSTGIPLNISVQPNEEAKIGSYQLTITNKSIDIVGVDNNGAFNGLQSLAALKSLKSNTLPLMNVDDEPHYEFRGILVDVSRNFHDKAFILKLLDQMAAYKMNKLHLHLGDDEGWRLEIPSLPELTQVSSKRCFDPSEQECLMPQLGAGVNPKDGVNGYYSVADYQEILMAASRRYIQVIPSLDMPGHSRAAVKAMNARYHKYMAKEQQEKAEEFLLHDLQDTSVYSSVQYYNDNTINVCMESSYRFIKTVMEEVKAIHQAANHPLTRYHIGADETAGAWIDSPACKSFLAKHKAQVESPEALGAYFVERVSNMLAQMGIEAAAWIDGLEHTNPDNMPPVVQANAWHPLAWSGHQSAHKLANYHWQVVVSSPDVTYFDFPYEADPTEHGYYWAARQANTQKMFNFMPDNLPAHAEFWTDRENNEYIADDTIQYDEKGKLLSSPLNKGVKFLGIQGQLWSENTRTEATAEYKIFPRLLALAERGWHSADWAVPYNYQGFKYSSASNEFTDKKRKQRDIAWGRFAATLGQKEMPKLDIANIHYRLPTVGAYIDNGMLYANVAFPGLMIEYQTSDNNWQTYTGPVAVDLPVKVRSVNSLGNRFSRPLNVEIHGE